MNKASIIDRMLDFEKHFLGLGYSQDYRYQIYKGGHADCSSLQAAAMSYAGFPLLTAAQAELLVSNTEVYAQGYDLIYPASKDLIGKVLPAPADTYKKLQRGDLVFYNFNSTTTRANKITHIGACLDSTHLIQTCNSRINLATYPIDWGTTRICAIIRLKDTVQSLTYPTVSKGVGPKWAIHTLQAILNYQGSTLLWDGQFGTNVDTAFKAWQTKVGLPATGVCDADDWNLLFAGAVAPPAPAIDINKLPSLIYPNGQAVCVDMKTPCPLIKIANGWQTDVKSVGSVMEAPVHYAQFKLQKLGYYKDHVDGEWGQNSHNAAVALQKAVGGFQNTGRVGPSTWKLLIAS